MPSPQLENGHTNIANELLDFLCSFRIPGECRQVFDAIMRKTWGWHKKEDYISGTQITEITKMKKGNVSRALSKLITNGLVIKSDNKLKINKDYSTWKPFGVIKSDNNEKVIKKATKVIKSDNKKLSKVRDTKEKKETIQKKEGGKGVSEYENLTAWWNNKYGTHYKKKPNKEILKLLNYWLENGTTVEDIKYAKTLAENHPKWGKGIDPLSLLRTRKQKSSDPANWVEYFLNYEGYHGEVNKFRNDYLNERKK